jgi:hypothetical protein
MRGYIQTMILRLHVSHEYILRQVIIVQSIEHIHNIIRKNNRIDS